LEKAMLTKRRENILGVIVAEYVANGLPVSSESVARKGLAASPATIRNEMLDLEEEGFLSQPHTSAGRIPTDKGYRHYIESLMGDVQLPEAEQKRIRQQFHRVEGHVEEWTRVAAAILSRLVRNVAIVTLPKPYESRFKHLELVALQDFLALLVLVLREAKLRQQLLPLEEAATQEELSATAQKLTAACGGLSGAQIVGMEMELSRLEEQVVGTVVRMMQAEEEEAYEEPYVDGLRHILGQPEFATSSRLPAIIGLFEHRKLLKALLPQVLTGEGVSVVIGKENKQDVMRDCSVVITRYGIPGEVGGAIGVMGPTRMRYNVAIPTVCFLSAVMSERVSELYG
jgi:heat-inducible transcriptional repressor